MLNFPSIQTIWESIALEHALIIAITFSVITVLFVIKLIHYHIIGWIELLLLLLLLMGSYATFMFDIKLNSFLILGLYFILIAYSIYAFICARKIGHLSQDKLYLQLKNENYDYYFSTNKYDQLMDASTSCLNKLGLKAKEARKVTGFELISEYLDLLKINQKDVNEKTLLNFKTDYFQARNQYQTYKFELEVLENGHISSYKGLVQPLYFQNRYQGKNIYLTRNRNELLIELQSALQEAITNWEDAKGLLHLLMSLSEQVILYYDFQTKTYVASDLFCKYTESKKREYNFDEFVELIHPDDLDFYIGQAATVNSLSTTRIKYRMRINNAYYHVVDDAIYLEKERGLVSIIHILEHASIIETKIKVEESKIISSTHDETLDELASNNPEGAFQEISKILKTVGKKDE